MHEKGATFNEYCVSCVWKSPIEIKQKHPTQKPIKLFNRLILASTNEKDIVLDCCMGSGTTAHSCN